MTDFRRFGSLRLGKTYEGGSMSTHSRGLLAGDKFNGNHSTVVKEARGLIKILAASPEVTKITIGVISPFGASKRRIKFHDTDAGFRMDVYTSDGVQQFHVYTRNRGKTKQLAENFWKNLYD